jgi:hypothetical protein
MFTPVRSTSVKEPALGPHCKLYLMIALPPLFGETSASQIIMILSSFVAAPLTGIVGGLDGIN